jgi:multimeric flavodoxin WrbA
MKIAVLNGSPKGIASITLLGVEYLRGKNPKTEFVFFHIAAQIDSLCGADGTFEKLCEMVSGCDGVLWSFPIYHFLVPAQMKRFVELVEEKNARGVFAGKYAASLSTSIHIMDRTAHSYLRGVSEDWGMNFTEALSASHELLSAEGRKALDGFFAAFTDAIARRAPVQRQYPPVTRSGFVYKSTQAALPAAHAGLKMLVITDGEQKNGNIAEMVRVFCQNAGADTEVLDISKVKTGWCLECLRCGPDKCVYENAPNDDFISAYREKVLPADIIIFAGHIENDRYLSWRFKRFFDRTFFKNHVPTYGGKQVGFIFSGPLAQAQNLWEILSTYPDGNGANNCGFVTDECGDSKKLDALLYELCAGALRSARAGYFKPATFNGVGIHKIVRDEVWGHLCFVFPRDHEFLSANGGYDFPHRNPLRVLGFRTLYWLQKIPFVKRKFLAHMAEGASAPFKKQLDALGK